MTQKIASKVFKLNTGYSIPLLGLGTYQITSEEDIFRSIDLSLSAGYRHIDTASVYRNEKLIGDALKTLLPKYSLSREDIFITTKLIPRHGQARDQVVETVKESLKYLQTDYIDLYLIHWPGAMGICLESPENPVHRKNVWSALVECMKDGFIRSVGVSNFTVEHLEELMPVCEGVPPAVNQVEWHPHYHQRKLLEYCREKGIFLQAYSSLGTSSATELRGDLDVIAIAKKLNKTTAQVLLRWAYQQNIGILPKARSKAHIDENIDIDFEIPEGDMTKLSTLNVGNKYAWDPENVR